MLRRIAVVCFTLGCALHGRAQEQEVYINGSDTLHYTVTKQQWQFFVVPVVTW